MVSLKKAETTPKEIEVQHLLTEEETIAQTVASVVEVQQPAALPAVVDNAEDKSAAALAAAKKAWQDAEAETEKTFRAFTWALFAITALLFIFNWVLGAILVPDRPYLEAVFVATSLLFGSLMLSTLITNIFSVLGLHLFSD